MKRILTAVILTSLVNGFWAWIFKFWSDPQYAKTDTLVFTIFMIVGFILFYALEPWMMKKD